MDSSWAGSTHASPSASRWSGASSTSSTSCTARSSCSGSYIAYFAYAHAGIHPFASIVIAGALLYALGHAIQAGIINRVIAAPVLITLTLTFGLDLILNNAMLVAFTADYRSINLARPLGIDRDRPGVPARRPGRGDGARAPADGAALPAAARQQHRPRHRGRAHGPRRGRADGRRRQAHQRHHLRHRRADGRRRRRAAQHHLSDLAAQQLGCFSARPSSSACWAASAACPAR